MEYMGSNQMIRLYELQNVQIGLIKTIQKTNYIIETNYTNLLYHTDSHE
jgi:hypothetical protein